LETFFTYLASLDTQLGIKYFILLCLVLGLFPYHEIILKYAKQIIFKKDLKIINFTYSTGTSLITKNDTNIKGYNVSNNSNNLLIINSKLNFVWEVEGASKIDLVPIGKKLKGNSASVIVDNKIKKYTLVAYGFKGEKVEAVIDFSNEIFYAIKTNPIASNTKIIRNTPIICAQKISKSKISTFKQTLTSSNILKNWFRNRLYEIETDNINANYFIKTNTNKNKLNDTISKRKILKSYSFSTKKYQSITID
jgi:hypothetical protein